MVQITFVSLCQLNFRFWISNLKYFQKVFGVDFFFLSLLFAVCCVFTHRSRQTHWTDSQSILVPTSNTRGATCPLWVRLGPVSLSQYSQFLSLSLQCNVSTYLRERVVSPVMEITRCGARWGSGIYIPLSSPCQHLPPNKYWPVPHNWQRIEQEFRIS